MGAVGSALGGALAEHQGPAAALALTSVMTAVGAILIYLRRDLLRAADRVASDDEAAEALADTTGQ
jgi:predicted MFS family arabinose efflux permease